MEYIGDVFYDYGGGLYVNMTNKCPCRCAFCIRDMVDSLGDADSLWLKREPSKEELMKTLKQQNLAAYDEIVFCGYKVSRCRVDWNLSGCNHKISDYICLCIRTDCCRCLVGCYDFSHFLSSLSYMSYLNPFFVVIQWIF